MPIPFVPSRVLVTGASGAVGRLVATAAASWRAPVRLLTHRSPLPESVVQALPDAERRFGDLERPETLRGIAAGCDVVIHAASRGGFAAHGHDRSRRVNVAGVDALLREATSAGVRAFVSVGYTGTVQERGSSEAVDEDSPPEGEYQAEIVREKFEGEALVLEANGLGGLRAMVVSAGAVIAPGIQTMLGGLVRAYVDEDLPYRLLDDAWLAVSDGRDLPRFLAAAVERGAGGRRYFAVSESLRLGDLYARLENVTGIAPPRRRLPNLLVEELGLLSPLLPPGSYLRRLVLPRDLALHLRRLAPLANDRTRRELAIEPTPLDVTLRDVARSGEGTGQALGHAVG